MSLLTDIAAQVQETERCFVTDLLLPVPLCPFDSRRYSIGFSSPAAATLIITTNPQLTPACGFAVAPGEMRWFNIKDHGSLAMAQWLLMPSASADPCVVFTVLLPRG